ncbi:Putative alpha-L-rhamnosidase, concanavalin-like domain, six-hairpin glycosidase superfamily [Septoria linicola]|uniref:alpha-L-rhamnosidase n=1 Tax=Septoria linicola TaxID=215465 RepID=A0A9Q9B109_9PEZI|nr:Putative alpha-L-rhamnosidase, concanavalin-like domain, six-hairpin glycosidase superfamily [Septoria linicola]
MEVVNCGIHGYHETIGIDEDEIYFHWSLNSTDYDLEQKAYQVVLSKSATREEAQVWNTGKVDSRAQRNISCKLDGGFGSTTSYYWHVTILKIAVEGDAGSEVVIRYAETVDEQGYVLMPDPLFKEFETHVYSKFTLAGTGEAEIWQPDFSFTSARYIQIEGVATESGHGLPIIHSAVGQHVSTAAKRLGSLTTDKEDVNRMINACHWSFVSNLFSYHTDCPQIEKFGWLEVTHLLAPATQYIRDIESLHSKILEDIIDAQEPSGFIPNMAPDTRFMCGPMRNCITWSCAICFIPEILKTEYGSTHMIKRVYLSAVRYIEYMQTWERKGGLIMHGLGDWGRDIAFGNLQANIETAVYYKCLQCLEMMASELDLPKRRRTFPHPSGSAYYTSLDNYPQRDCISIAQAIALQFQLVPPEHQSAVSTSFLSSSDITEGVMRSGEIGLPHLFNTLSALRRPDTVLKMARQEEHPSYMRFLRRGETTLLEFWQDECRSKCHDVLGTVYEWIYNTVLGVTVVEKAYRKWRLRPCREGEFREVEGSVDCPYGPIEVRTKRNEDDSWKVEVTVPMSTTCNFELLEKHGDIKVERFGNADPSISRSAANIELRPGKYTIFVAPPA